MMNTGNDEAVKIVNALKPFIKSWNDEWNRNAVRSKQMTVKVAPNGATMGVVDAFSDTVMYIPYSTGLSNARVGDTVWCIWMGNNMQSLVAMWTGMLDLGDVGGGGGSGDLPSGGLDGDILTRVGASGAAWITPASDVEEDNTRPITSAAVYTEVGNINALLNSI